MAHPLTWPSSPKFHPMGWTPATSLTQDLSPEQSADILLLGCGDPRHILYTISTDVTAPPSPRKLDITCCDLEPAVIARNIILFTLLDNGISSATVWDIFYHLKLSDHVAGVLATHARELVKLSATCDSWRESKYGSFLKFVDGNSLFELRRFWTFYADFPNLSSIRLDKLKKEQAAVSGKISSKLQGRTNHGVSRSATVVWEDSSKAVSDQFSQYWKNGTTATTNKELQKITTLNSTFCYSAALGETFHDSLDTVFPQGFHFAPAFVPIEVDPVGSNVTTAMAKAKQQFKASCLALQASRTSNALTLRFFVGDAIALSKALDRYAKSGDPKTGLYMSPWRAVPIDLTGHATSDPKAPTSFDVIDTSVLADSLGMVNVLLVTQPLLKSQPDSQAVVYMDLKFGVTTAVENLKQALCCDVPKAGILLGLVPRPYVSLFTSISNTHELNSENDTGYMERVAWVDPTSGDKHTNGQSNPVVSLHALDICKMIFGIHRHLFIWDATPVAAIPSLEYWQLQMSSSPHYVCETVADIWVRAQSRVQIANGNWEGAITSFHGIVEGEPANPLAVSSSAETEVQYRLRGLPMYEPNGGSIDSMPSTGIFHGWSDVPRVVCVVLTVPRSALEPLRTDQEKLSPRLVCTIQHPSKDHKLSTYASIHAAWGKCVPLDNCGESFAIEEDLHGFRGLSDLIVSFWVDSRTITYPDLKISFAIRFTPLAYRMYARKLGRQLNLFTTSLGDKDSVIVLRERPMGLSQVQETSKYLAPPLLSRSSRIKHRLTVGEDGLVFPCQLIDTQLKFESDSERATADAGTMMVEQIGPCTLQVSTRKSRHLVPYPYPILGAQVKSRVDKKTHHLSLIVPVYKPTESGGYPFDLFPILQRTNFSPWNLHHIALDCMPKLDLRNIIRNPAKLRWLSKHTTSQMSDRERFVQHCTNPIKRLPSNVLVNIKESIDSVVQVYAGLRQASRAVFTLSKPLHGIHTIICVGGLRLDLTAATVVLDVAVVPWSREVAKIWKPETPAYDIQTPVGDVAAWKRLVASSVERCRTWLHGPNCEYKSTNNAPRSVLVEDDPLCSCGRGIGFESPSWQVAGWESLLSNGTRAAISPLFGVSYLEPILGPGLKLHDEQQPISWDEPTNKCWRCGHLPKSLMGCQKCKRARYCSKECQMKHWKAEHKRVCKPVETM